MMCSYIKFLRVTRHQMLRGERKQIDENRSETIVKTYGVHLASIRLPDITVTLPVFGKAGISQ